MYRKKDILALLIMGVGMTTLPLQAADINFNGLPEGYNLDENALSTGWGISGPLSGEVSVTGNPNPAIVFASDCLPGGCSGEDVDLGTPNECVSGSPGVDAYLLDGTGGECGSPFENKVPLYNVAIVAEDLIDGDLDGNIDDPDDIDVADSYIEFDFKNLKGKGVTVNSITYMDNDEGEDDAMVFFWGPGTLNPSTIGLDAVGDNGVLTLTPGIAGVDRMQVLLAGSGAVTSVVIEEEINRPCWVTLGGFNKNNGTVSDPAGEKICTFGGNVGPPPSGSFEVNWHGAAGDLAGSKFHTNAIVVDHCEDLTSGPGQPGGKKGFTDDTLFFTCDDGKFNGVSGHTCRGYFQDNGEPQGKKGKANDKICMEVSDSSGVVALCGPGCDPADPDEGSTLVGGNVQIHPCLGNQCEPK